MLRKTLPIVTNLAKLNKIKPIFINRTYSIYEPDYLDALRPKYPIYDTINFQMKGYDYTVLENYQKFVHRIADSMDIEVTDSWATPPKQLQIQRFKPNTAVIDAEYKLTLYNRTIQMSDVAAPAYPILLRIAQSALPEGVTFDVVEHTEDQEEIRYVPDKELIDLKSQLDEMGGPLHKKK